MPAEGSATGPAVADQDRGEVVDRLVVFLRSKASVDAADKAKALLWRCAAEGRGIGPLGPLVAAEVAAAVERFDEARTGGEPGPTAGTREPAARAGPDAPRPAAGRGACVAGAGEEDRDSASSGSEAGREVIPRPWGPSQHQRPRHCVDARPRRLSGAASDHPGRTDERHRPARPGVVRELAAYLGAQPASRRESAKEALRSAVQNGWRIAGVSSLSAEEVEQAIEDSEEQQSEAQDLYRRRAPPSAALALPDRAWSRDGGAGSPRPGTGTGTWSRVVEALREAEASETSGRGSDWDARRPSGRRPAAQAVQAVRDRSPAEVGAASQGDPGSSSQAPCREPWELVYRGASASARAPDSEASPHPGPWQAGWDADSRGEQRWQGSWSGWGAGRPEDWGAGADSWSGGRWQGSWPGWYGSWSADAPYSAQGSGGWDWKASAS